MAEKLKGPCPYSTANWLSRFIYWWIFPLFRYGFRHPLTQDILYDVLPEDQSHLLGDRMEKSWNDHVKKCEKKGKKPSLYWAVIAEFKWEWGINGIFLVVSVPRDQMRIEWDAFMKPEVSIILPQGTKGIFSVLIITLLHK
ncbi:ATP-binding cassette sub-family C member 4-like [Magallana gigas]|uniref:ATP-binding cassette sub-family C member 4-like n=1 Tax=Magallana gigas TaxID=29159 RepID=UPI00333E4FAF